MTILTFKREMFEENLVVYTLCLLLHVLALEVVLLKLVSRLPVLVRERRVGVNLWLPMLLVLTRRISDFIAICA